MTITANDLKKVVDCVNQLTENGVKIVNTKKIRAIIGVKSSERSKIYKIWNNLEFLEELGVLKLISNKSPKSYEINSGKAIDWEKFKGQFKDKKIIVKNKKYNLYFF